VYPTHAKQFQFGVRVETPNLRVKEEFSRLGTYPFMIP
jgi:hypothetical protein